jgi:hypothetical protein
MSSEPSPAGPRGVWSEETFRLYGVGPTCHFAIDATRRWGISCSCFEDFAGSCQCRSQYFAQLALAQVSDDIVEATAGVGVITLVTRR